LDVPPFNRSTVDGYAVKAEDTFGAEENKPVKLKICGTVNVGELPKIMVKHGMTAEIMTGAPLPEGADAIVMTEHTQRKNNTLYVYSAVTKNENVMKVGKILSIVEVLNFSVDACERYGQIVNDLRRKDSPIGDLTP
ncbi:MAG: hypothetical protein QXH17_08065, partial [Candidatus Bathyarchaeia archaeon]